jgi:hypothetical protein
VIVAHASVCAVTRIQVATAAVPRCTITCAGTAVTVSIHVTGSVAATVIVRILARVDGTRIAGPFTFAGAAVIIRMRRAV